MFDHYNRNSVYQRLEPITFERINDSVLYTTIIGGRGYGRFDIVPQYYEFEIDFKVEHCQAISYGDAKDSAGMVIQTGGAYMADHPAVDPRAAMVVQFIGALFDAFDVSQGYLIDFEYILVVDISERE